MLRSTFSERLVRLNHLEDRGFRAWALHPGMLFGAEWTWWGNTRKRDRPHEGLDLCLYVDDDGTSHPLDNGARVPVIYGGQIVKIDDDLLGKSIYVRHVCRDESGNILYSIYGHTSLAEDTDIDVSVGASVGDGDTIACIIDTLGRKTAPSHLHVSVVWAPESLPVQELTWANISARRVVKPIDPLAFLGLPHVLLMP